jgi:hypothetical protein
MIFPKAVVLSMQVFTLVGASDRVPQLDVEPVCRGIAEQGGVTFHDAVVPKEKKNCMESENAVRAQLVKQWAGFPADDRTHCINETTMGGESSYTELLTCLEMARDVRTMRAEAEAHPRADASHKQAPTTTSPPPPPATPTGSSRSSASLAPSSPSMPAAQPTSAGPLPRAMPTNDIPNFELDSMRKELDRAKADTQAATVSEVSAQRKLADAEAALQRTKEEAEQERNEARHAKDDAQAAKASEAAQRRKLADAEAAQGAAEKQCQSAAKSPPGIGEQLRKWFRGE